MFLRSSSTGTRSRTSKFLSQLRVIISAIGRSGTGNYHLIVLIAHSTKLSTLGLQEPRAPIQSSQVDVTDYQSTIANMTQHIVSLEEKISKLVLMTALSRKINNKYITSFVFTAK